MKYFIWGLGAVGFSFLKKIKENGFFEPSLFYCIDCDPNAKEKFLEIGGTEDNFICDKITKINYYEYLEKLGEDDFLFDFTIDVKSLDILKYCLDHNIHYINTADCSWNPDPSWISLHQHYLEYIKIKRKYLAKQNTIIADFGMNPGLVSCFVKMCLKDIVNKDGSLYIKFFRKKLLSYIRNNQYNILAKKLKVRFIQEIDNDSHETNIGMEEDVCYSTWNPQAFYFETISSPELALGNKKEYYSFKEIFDCDRNDLYIGLLKSGYEYKKLSMSPQGEVMGHISTHEEIFTIRNYLTYKKYRPMVYFVYSPCKVAMESFMRFNNKRPEKFQIVGKENIISGGESVGVIVQGKRFKTRYYGNFLKTSDTNESATICQVAASSYAAFIYTINHPKEGILLPEDLNEEEVLLTAKAYLGDYISSEYTDIDMTIKE